MKKPSLSDKPVRVSLDGETLTLEPTIENCIALCEAFDGAMPVYRSLANGNLLTAARVIDIGANLNTKRADFSGLVEKVRDAGPSVFEAATEFAVRVFSGGIAPDPDPDTEIESGN